MPSPLESCIYPEPGHSAPLGGDLVLVSDRFEGGADKAESLGKEEPLMPLVLVVGWPRASG